MITLSATDVRTCEACWTAPVTAARHTEAGRDLLCEECAAGDYPRRVDLFPPARHLWPFGPQVADRRQAQRGPPEAPTHPGPTAAQPTAGTFATGDAAGVELLRAHPSTGGCGPGTRRSVNWGYKPISRCRCASPCGNSRRMVISDRRAVYR